MGHESCFYPESCVTNFVAILVMILVAILFAILVAILFATRFAILFAILVAILFAILVAIPAPARRFMAHLPPDIWPWRHVVDAVNRRDPGCALVYSK